MGHEYKNIMSILNRLYEKEELKENLILAGGIVPYFITKEDSGRLHSDIDFICEISKIDIIRNYFMKNGYYDNELDSRTFFDQEFGFEFYIDNIKVGIYPFIEKNKEIIQRSYDSKKKQIKAKSINVDLENYVEKKSECKTMKLEVILKSKVMVAREKDINDINKICEIGFDNNLYKNILISVVN